MDKSFRRIGLLTQLRHREVQETLHKLIQLLSRLGHDLVIEAVTAEMVSGHEFRALPSAEMAQSVDLVVVVGGDGSMLGAAREMVNFDVPLLGVNRGRLGFLTDIRPDELEERVVRVLAGEYVVTDRFLLEVNVYRDEQQVDNGRALNDLVLHPGKSVRMMEFELYIDKQFVYSQRSDGLIVSTPTGSTAYALSAGGPILHPGLDAIVLVPMNPHTLTSRPFAIAGNSNIEILVGARNEQHPVVTCDGQVDVHSEPGDIISISKQPHPLRLIHPVDHNFYEICRSKLGWGSRLDSGAPLHR